MHIPAIERIEVTPFQIPLATFLRSGRQMHVKKAENVLVRVTADDGTVGIAEANAFAELFGESQVSIVHAISDWIAPRVKGIALCDFERLWHELDIMRNNNSAKAAVDMAVHDALARVLGLPMYRMLGGYRDRVPRIAISKTLLQVSAGAERVSIARRHRRAPENPVLGPRTGVPWPALLAAAPKTRTAARPRRRGAQPEPAGAGHQTRR